jgi:hypothetical protein
MTQSLSLARKCAHSGEPIMNFTEHRLKRLLIRFTLGLVGPLAFGQVNIQNPEHLEVPEQRVVMLHQIICRVVADQLHIRDGKAEFPITVVFGEQEQRIIADENKGLFQIYLKHWDEPSFAGSDLHLVLQQATIRKHWQAMVRQVVRRYHKVTPVGVGQLNDTAKVSSQPIKPSATMWPFRPEYEQQREYELQHSDGSSFGHFSRRR